MIFILRQMKLIIKRKVLHLASLWKWGFSELGNDPLWLAEKFRATFHNQSEGNLNQSWRAHAYFPEVGRSN